MDLIAKAMIMCAKAHGNQRDKANKPYVLHPMRVAANFSDKNKIIISLLHDVIEDSNITFEDIEKRFRTYYCYECKYTH